MKQMLDLLESEGPKSMSYEDICSWAEGQDWVSKDWATHVPPLDATGEYTRNILCLKPFEVVLLHWPPGTESAVHHHQGFWGCVVCLSGTAENVNYTLEEGVMMVEDVMRATPGGIIPEPDGTIHKIRNGSAKDPLVTLHLYHPALETLDGLVLYDVEAGKRVECNEKAPTASLELPQDCYRRVEVETFVLKADTEASHIPCNQVPKPSSKTIEGMVNRYYQEHAAAYDAQDAQVQKRQAYTSAIDIRVAKQLQDMSGRGETVERVMHLACGTGRRAERIRMMAGLSYQMFGVDLCEDMAEQAQTRGVEVQVASLTDPFDAAWNGSFDALTILYAYGHIPSESDRLHLLRSAFEWLRPGGVLCLDVFSLLDPHEWGPKAAHHFEAQRLGPQGYERGDVFYRRNAGEELAFLHYCTKEGILNLVERAGFEVLDFASIAYAEEGDVQRSEDGKFFLTLQRPF